MNGWYYLHTNGKLIYKPEPVDIGDLRESDFVRAFWPIDVRDRETAWTVLIEALSLGAKYERVVELAKKWGCDDNDAQIYADRLNLMTRMDGDKWCVHHLNFTNLQEYPAGFGDTILEALSDFCRNLGYKAGKMWNASFKDLCNA